MSPQLPVGQDVSEDGRLPEGVGIGANNRTLSVYVHVPFCTVRCGYCDFNTYTNAELGPGANRAEYLNSVLAELVHVDGVFQAANLPNRPVETVFWGGGTPSLLPAQDITRFHEELNKRWPLAPNAEITLEANPDTVDEAYFSELRAGGVSRVSIGMQSAVKHVLARLDRTHNVANVAKAVSAAKAVGLQVSLDLIYGTPSESISDWRQTLETALSHDVDHISAYALVLEPGTAMFTQARQGKFDFPNDDDQAAKYELTEELLSATGFENYEISNWARRDAKGELMVCRHNLAYWKNQDWWGFGPGAHSFIGSSGPDNFGLRRWNRKHPLTYAKYLAEGKSPGAGQEIIDQEATLIEQVMLAVRLAGGLNLDELTVQTSLQDLIDRSAELVKRGLIDAQALNEQTIRLTKSGRLLADHVVKQLVF